MPPPSYTHLVFFDFITPHSARPVIHSLFTHIKANLKVGAPPDGHRLLSGQFHSIAHEQRTLSAAFDGSV